MYYNTRGTDDNLDVEMPNWITRIELTDEEIHLTAKNSEVDYYFLELEKSVYEINHGKFLSWGYSLSGKDDGTQTIPRLTIPKVIADAIEETYFQSADNLEIGRLSATDYGAISSYDEIVEWLALNGDSPLIVEDNYRSLYYPTNSSSGKFYRAKPSREKGRLSQYSLKDYFYRVNNSYDLD